MKHFFFFLILLLCLARISAGQVFNDSNLPIVVIDVDHNWDIPDDPRVLATMRIIYRGRGERNYLTDADSANFLNYSGRISIEVRGSSTQELPKKQYGFSTLENDDVTEKNVSLMDFPADNDWILNGLGFEPSCIRDYLCYNLANMTGEYASRTSYCEVVINGIYNGLYVLEEKIKQGPERVNVKKIGINDNSYPGVTGGYIVKADKPGGDPVAWMMSSYRGTNDVTFILDQPKPELATPEQTAYIKSQFLRLADAASAKDATFDAGYPSVIDVPTFVDYMLLNELSANVDAYEFSTFYHKDRNGKLRAGPVWDMNLTFGNDLFIWGSDRSKTDTWQFSNGDNEGPMYWRDLFNEPFFRCCLARRWHSLIMPGQPFSVEVIDSLIDAAADTIREAVVRENDRWGSVPDFQGEIARIKGFVTLRSQWITEQLAPATGCCNLETPPLVITKIMYNPDTSRLFPVSTDLEFIEVTNTGSKAVILTGIYFTGTGFVYQFPPYTQINPGEARIIAGNMVAFRQRYGFAPSGQFTRNLSNSDEDLVMVDGYGNVIDHVHYYSQPPWPDANGNGKYLELTDPGSDNNIAGNWIASSSELTATNEVVRDRDPLIYPSPVTDFLNVESDVPLDKIQLFGPDGRKLIERNPASVSCRLDLKPYAPGLYIIRIMSVRGMSVHKIIKK